MKIDLNYEGKMNTNKQRSLADALVEKGILNVEKRPLSLAVNILGYNQKDTLKRVVPLPPVNVYTPTSDEPELADFCMHLNRSIAEKIAAEEMLISTPYHLMNNNDVQDKLLIAHRYRKVCEKVSMMSRQDVYDTLGAKDTNMARAVGRLAQSGKLLELKVGALSEPLYPAFQFNSDLVLHPGIEEVIEHLKEHDISVLSFCDWVASEHGFMKAVISVSKKYKKLPFNILASQDDTKQLLDNWCNDLLFG